MAKCNNSSAQKPNLFVTLSLHESFISFAIFFLDCLKTSGSVFCLVCCKFFLGWMHEEQFCVEHSRFFFLVYEIFFLGLPLTDLFTPEMANVPKII